MPQIVIKFSGKTFGRYADVTRGSQEYETGQLALRAVRDGNMEATEEQLGVLEEIIAAGVTLILSEEGFLEAHIPSI